MQPSDSVEVFNTINSLNPNKSSGADDISTYFVTQAASVIAIPLSLLANDMFSFGIFPDKLKIAKMIPILKSGNETNPSTYRPIPLLAIFLDSHLQTCTLSSLQLNTAFALDI